MGTESAGRREGFSWRLPDHPALEPSGPANFFAELPGWHIGHEEPGTAVVAASPQGPFFAFQQADGCQAPVWPPTDGEQRPVLHFDFQAGDLDSTVVDAVALAAAFQPQQNVRVLFDPAGPLCLCFDEAVTGRGRLIRALSHWSLCWAPALGSASITSAATT
ncbi:VOC family protein [Streptomyces sp. DSM 3412]|uniref:VOC family protein n=1 Tax=Streptomyces gottesmaniae TaxID=3075518 RepID=A0ABU2Z6S2_9ACTN|nr:VOC family protein [Streptomyces sp. DSM 3412]MDT0571896.1 VOC family protein [Streptomyces sp. DSM 3412]